MNENQYVGEKTEEVRIFIVHFWIDTHNTFNEVIKIFLLSRQGANENIMNTLSSE